MKTAICTCRDNNLGIYCSEARKWICEHNSLLGSCPDIMKFWSNKNVKTPDKITNNSNKKFILICFNCKNENTRIPGSFARNGAFKCGNCKIYNYLREKEECDCVKLGKAKKTHGKSYICEHNNLLSLHPEVKDYWSSRNKMKPEEVSKCADISIWLLCPVCQYEEEKRAAVVSHLLTPYECPKCYIRLNILAVRCPDIVNFWSPRNEISPYELSYGSRIVVFLLCQKCNSEILHHPSDLSTRGNYYCDNCYLNENNVAVLYPHFIIQVSDGTDLTKLTTGSTKLINWKCEICEYEWITSVDKRINGSTNDKEHGTGCRKCSGSLPTTYREFFDRINSEHKGKYILPETFPEEIFSLRRHNVTGKCPEHGLITKKGHNWLKCPCKNCKSPKSKLCIEIDKWLEIYKICYETEKTYPELVSVGLLRYDYLLNIDGIEVIIEADGAQHFNSSNWDSFNNTLQDRIKRDIIKDQFAVNNKINLIRIPYNMIKMVEDILKELMKFCKKESPFIHTYQHYSDKLKLTSEIYLSIVKSPNINLKNNEVIEEDESYDEEILE